MLSIKEIVDAAAAEGRAKYLIVKEAEQEAIRKKAEEEAIKAAKLIEECDAWVIAMLPTLVRTESELGYNHLELPGEPWAAACRRAGLRTSDKWQEKCMDEGADMGSFFRYYIHW